MSNAVPGTSLSCITDKKWSLSVFSQLVGRNINRSKHLDGVWSNSKLTAAPVEATPFASVTYSSGKQIRVYYLDSNYTIQEFCYTEGKGWYQGEVGKMNVKALPGAGLAAVVQENNGVALHVYYQEPEGRVIRELYNNGSWHQGELLIGGAIGGTYLAAVTYDFQNQNQVRIYYQAEDLFIREHCHNNDGWFPGELNSGPAFVRTSIAAVVFGSVELRVFYRDAKSHVVSIANTGSWGSPKSITGIGPSTGLAVLQWEGGKYFRVYIQDPEGPVNEFCSDDGGKTWFAGQKDLTQ